MINYIVTIDECKICVGLDIVNTFFIVTSEIALNSRITCTACKAHFCKIRGDRSEIPLFENAASFFSLVKNDKFST